MLKQQPPVVSAAIGMSLLSGSVHDAKFHTACMRLPEVPTEFVPAAARNKLFHIIWLAPWHQYCYVIAVEQYLV